VIVEVSCERVAECSVMFCADMAEPRRNSVVPMLPRKSPQEPKLRRWTDEGLATSSWDGLHNVRLWCLLVALLSADVYVHRILIFGIRTETAPFTFMPKDNLKGVHHFRSLTNFYVERNVYRCSIGVPDSGVLKNSQQDATVSMTVADHKD